MKIILSLILLFAVTDIFAATYSNTLNWYKNTQRHVVETPKALAERLRGMVDQPLYQDQTSGFTVKDGEIHHYVDQHIYQKVGHIEKCDGLAETCIIMAGYFKIYLPKDFSFDHLQHWQWAGCHYQTVAKMEDTVFGVPVSQVKIKAFCQDDMFDVIEFDIDKNLGITRFGFYAAGIHMHYTLSSNIGFFGKEKKGNYVF